MQDHHSLLQDTGLSFSEQLASRLLYHPSCDVRISSLSLFIRSTSTARPFSPFCLLILEHALPHFYLEHDARARNEFLSIIKKLCNRLQAAIIRMRKSSRVVIDSSRNGYESATQKTSLIADTTQCERLHVEFVAWFHEFLLHGLQPTASYQRHIIALKSLSCILSSGLNNMVKVGCSKRRMVGDGNTDRYRTEYIVLV